MASKYSKCPICGAPLEVDVEYMQDTYGSSYAYMPKKDWTFYCSDEDNCGEAGTFDELTAVAKLQAEASK